jgi:hypothetical protein
MPKKFDPSLPVYEICARLRQGSFPFPEHLPAERVAWEIDKLRDQRLRLDGDKIQPWSAFGLRLCQPFFPNRYRAVSKGTKSAFDAWHDDKLLREAVAFQLRHKDPVRPERVLRAVTMQQRTPTIFKPSVARFLCERYCPRGGRVWDPCAGYGGRLLGAFVAGVHYIGTDVDEGTIEGNRQLAAAVGSDAELILQAAEMFVPPPVDFVMTSPPYFDREQYSDDKEQSWKKYTTLASWQAGFMRQMADRALVALSRSGHFVINVADLRERGRTVPVVDAVREAVLAAGFRHVETLQMPLAAINRKAPTEPVLVFQKP